jgi:hypothetical protein
VKEFFASSMGRDRNKGSFVGAHAEWDAETRGAVKSGGDVVGLRWQRRSASRLGAMRALRSWSGGPHGPN